MIKKLLFFILCFTCFNNILNALDIKSNDDPILLLADDISHDKTFDRTIAEGNVEITQGKEILKADKLTYQHKEDIITASGNVILTRQDGTYYGGDYIELTGDFKEATVQALKVRMSENVRFVANVGELKRDNTKIFTKGVYSPCNLCKEHPEKAPLWQLKSRKIVHDENNGTISYRDAYMEFLGVPIAYTPYFVHPDPETKRKSGFLSPYYRQSSKVGLSFYIPYYWAMNESAEMLFTPIFTTTGRKLLKHNYRHLIPYGEISMETSLAYTKFDRYIGKSKAIEYAPLTKKYIMEKKALNHKYDSHQFWKINLHPNDIWQFGANYNHTSEKFYLKNYNFWDKDYLMSDAYIDGLWEYDYFSYRAEKIQGLREMDDPQKSERLLPISEYHLFRDLGQFGSIRFDTTYRHLTRDIRPQSQLFSCRPSWEKRAILPFGFTLTSNAALRSDYYQIKGFSPETYNHFDGHASRLYSEFSLVTSYPWLLENNKSALIIEPLIGFVSAPKGQNKRHNKEKIPQDDSSGFEFTENKLFHPNLYQGFDRVSGGNRIDYAFKTQFLYNAQTVFDSTIGQLYQLTEPEDFGRGSGLHERLSDVVSSSNFTPVDYFKLLHRIRYNPHNNRIRRNEVGFGIGPNRFRFDLSYIHLRGNPNKKDDPFVRTHQVTPSLNIGITPFFKTTFKAVQEINRRRTRILDNGERVQKFWRKKTLYYILGAGYDDECFTANFSVKRNLVHDKKIDRHEFLFNIGFKTLGL
ncbi:MAG: LPS assembly protein LptD [Alphaproteobacteria bacterium]|nr:LPS assembly protein LptD [Alphaproteobacteria bacterium]